MPPPAGRYFRQRPFLTAELCEKWKVGNSTFVARTFSGFEARTECAGISGCKPPGLVARGFCMWSGRSFSIVVSRRAAQQSGCVAKGQLGRAEVAVHGGCVSAVLAKSGFAACCGARILHATICPKDFCRSL